MAFHLRYSVDLLEDLYENVINEGTIITLEGRFTRYDIAPTVYEYDGASTATDDGINVIQPTGHSTGRWLRVQEVQTQGDWNETDTTAYGYLNNKPMLAPVATSGSYGSLTSKPTIPTTSDQLTEGTTNLFITNGRVRSALGAGSGISYNSSTGVVTNTSPAVSPTSSNPSRAISTTGANNTYTISTTRAAFAVYTINFSAALTLTTSSGKVSLDYSLDGGTTWNIGPSVSQVFSLALTINFNQDQVLSRMIPANALVRINRITNTNVTIALSANQEEVLF